MAPGVKVAELPAGPLNHHCVKNVIASEAGDRPYVTVGSNINVAEHGMAVEHQRAAIWDVDPPNGTYRICASGLRNPNGLDFEPVSGALWTAVNERDEIGPNLVPDYITSVRDGGFYGWPWSCYGSHGDGHVPAAASRPRRARDRAGLCRWQSHREPPVPQRTALDPQRSRARSPLVRFPIDFPYMDK